MVPQGLSSMNNGGPHGLSEVLYCFGEAANNNGSAFAGLNANTPFYNIGAGIVIWIGRFIPIIAALAIVGRLASQEDRRSLLRHAADARLDLRPDPDRRHHHRGRADVLPGAVPGTDCRARADAGGPGLLSTSKLNFIQITMSTKVEFSYSALFRQAVIDAFKKLHPARRDQEPGHVRRVARLDLDDDHPLPARPVQPVQRPDLLLALVHLPLRQLRRGHGRRPRQGPRRRACAKCAPKPWPARWSTARRSQVASTELKVGDYFVCEAGRIDRRRRRDRRRHRHGGRVGDHGRIRAGRARERRRPQRGHRRHRVISDRIVVRVTAEAGHSFLDRMIAMIEGARRQKTPNEIALNIVLVSLTALFIVVVFVLPPYAHYNEDQAGQKGVVLTSIPVLLSLIVCLIPTTIGGLLSAIGIAGIDRLMRRNVLATSGRAVEAAGDVDVLLLDKTGTITLGNRQATEFIPAHRASSVQELADAAQLASLADETPEGRSIVVLAKEKYGLRGREMAETHATFVPFTAQTRMSGVDLFDGQHCGGGRPRMPSANAGSRRPNRAGGGRCGASTGARPLPAHADPSASAKAPRTPSLNLSRANGGNVDQSVMDKVDEISRLGGTPLVVADRAKVLGVILLKDIVKGGIKERFAQLRKMGVRTVMITGDNQLTAAAIAAEAGVDDFIAQAKPEDKLARIRKEQEGGKLIAMIGDGTNDAPALAQADVGVAMNTGTQAAREAGNMVDLDSNPTKLIEVVEIGKQLLMTRGALTTFSIANDVSKYFAIIPAMFGLLYALHAGGRGPLDKLNIMFLHSPQSAILSAVIFNALIIVALIPLALRGVKYQPAGRRGDPAQQHAHLRHRRHHRAVHLHQTIDLLLVLVHLAP